MLIDKRLCFLTYAHLYYCLYVIYLKIGDYTCCKCKCKCFSEKQANSSTMYWWVGKYSIFNVKCVCMHINRFNRPTHPQQKKRGGIFYRNNVVWSDWMYNSKCIVYFTIHSKCIKAHLRSLFRLYKFIRFITVYEKRKHIRILW